MSKDEQGRLHYLTGRRDPDDKKIYILFETVIDEGKGHINTVNHTPHIDNVKSIVSDAEFEVVVGKPRPTSMKSRINFTYPIEGIASSEYTASFEYDQTGAGQKKYEIKTGDDTETGAFVIDPFQRLTHETHEEEDAWNGGLRHVQVMYEYADDEEAWKPLNWEIKYNLTEDEKHNQFQKTGLTKKRNR